MSSSIEEIKARLNIVDVVQGYLRLQRAGINFKANCPFHNEKTPSFFVSPTRQTWHCFGCNRGGDIFSFVMEIEGIEFIEALKMLADRAGVKLEPFEFKTKGEREKILKIIEESKNFYIGELEKREDVKNYLKERGLKEETIKIFNIGFAPSEWRSLYNYLRNKKFSDADIEKSGMIIRSEKGIYDRFRSRIMFPINDYSGKTVGFSGRIFGDEDEKLGKYINTPQTIIYDKSKIIYGFDKAKEEIRRKDVCILVEGQMDMIMSYQAGIKNVVAVSGTSLTNEHLKMIKRFTDNLIMSFDKDEAGLAAAKRAIDMALENDFEIKTAIVDNGKDPADLIKSDPKRWEEIINRAKNIFDFYLDNIDNLEMTKKIKETQETILPRIAVLTSEIKKGFWVREISKRLNIKEDAIWEELKKIKVEFKKEDDKKLEKEIKKNIKSRAELLKKRVLGFIFWQKETEDLELKKEMDLFISDYKLDLESEEIKKDIEEVIFESEILYNNADLKKEFKNLVYEFKKESIKSELIFLTEKIKILENKKENQGLTSEENSLLENYLENFYKLTKEISKI